MIYDYNVWDDASGYDAWSEDPTQALQYVVDCKQKCPGVMPRIAQYPVGLNAHGERTTFTDRWTILTPEQLFALAFPYAYAALPGVLTHDRQADTP